jgi:hypothetical protein
VLPLHFISSEFSKLYWQAACICTFEYVTEEVIKSRSDEVTHTKLGCYIMSSFIIGPLYIIMLRCLNRCNINWRIQKYLKTFWTLNNQRISNVMGQNIQFACESMEWISLPILWTSVIICSNFQSAGISVSGKKLITEIC